MISTNSIIGKPELMTIVMRSSDPKVKRALYCIHCGTMLQMTYEQPRVVIQGSADKSVIRSEVQCRRCKALFEIC